MRTTGIFINQLRQKIGVIFGSPETTTGGNAMKFFASIRLDVRRIGKVQAGTQVVGNRTRVKVVKNKLAPPFCEAEFEIRFGQGIDKTTELLDAGLAAKIIQQAGSYYSLFGQQLGQGRDRARQSLQEQPALLERLRKELTGASVESAASQKEPGGGTEAKAETSAGGVKGAQAETAGAGKKRTAGGGKRAA